MRRNQAAVLLTLTVSALAGCESMRSLPIANAPTEPGRPDVHSYANPEQVRVTHADLDLFLDFATQQVRGRARLDLERLDREAPLYLDTSKLDIRWVEGADGGARPYDLGPEDPILGAPLAISLAPRETHVTVHYETSPDAGALQWLKPAMTAGKEQPYLFTQGQAILTRSWIPLQDSPGVRITYNARVTAPNALNVVMSSMERDRSPEGAWTFGMSLPVPPYLIALACGDIQRKELSDRVAIYAEPQVLPDAAREFEDTPAMLAGCEELFGPYRWGRYDILVLPPAFPFGGMENPCLTFATPTILAGDKSLVALIAHELAHSWSGNLVTNATWRDFWLNEGFTVYLEKRIMEHVFGAERARMEILNDLKGLVKELRSLPEPDQKLHIELAGRNPDDAMTAVAYDKGATFLRRLEEVFGRERFDEFLTGYFEHFAFQSITTADFRTYLQRNLLEPAGPLGESVDVEAWIEGIGLPEDHPVPISVMISQVDRLRGAVMAGDQSAIAAAREWNTQQWLRFLNALPTVEGTAGFDDELYRRLDDAFQLTASNNAEILNAWMGKAVRAHFDAVADKQEDFLLSVGRRKFLTPQYQALLDAGQRERALEIYGRARPSYHSVATGTLDVLLGWSPKQL